MENKSGKQIGAENLERLRAYLDSVASEGRALPVHRNGQVNRSAIALACGFDRQVLYKNDAAVGLLQASVERLGLATPSAPTEGSAAAQQVAIDAKSQRIQRLESRLVTREAEVSDLRKQVAELEGQIASYRAIEEHMIQTGRRVVA